MRTTRISSPIGWLFELGAGCVMARKLCASHMADVEAHLEQVCLWSFARNTRKVQLQGCGARTPHDERDVVTMMRFAMASRRMPRQRGNHCGAFQHRLSGTSAR